MARSARSRQAVRDGNRFSLESDLVPRRPVGWLRRSEPVRGPTRRGHIESVCRYLQPKDRQSDRGGLSVGFRKLAVISAAARRQLLAMDREPLLPQRSRNQSLICRRLAIVGSDRSKATGELQSPVPPPAKHRSRDQLIEEQASS